MIYTALGDNIIVQPIDNTCSKLNKINACSKLDLIPEHYQTLENANCGIAYSVFPNNPIGLCYFYTYNMTKIADNIPNTSDNITNTIFNVPRSNIILQNGILIKNGVLVRRVKTISHLVEAQDFYMVVAGGGSMDKGILKSTLKGTLKGMDKPPLTIGNLIIAKPKAGYLINYFTDYELSTDYQQLYYIDVDNILIIIDDTGIKAGSNYQLATNDFIVQGKELEIEYAGVKFSVVKKIIGLKN